MKRPPPTLPASLRQTQRLQVHLGFPERGGVKRKSLPPIPPPPPPGRWREGSEVRAALEVREEVLRSQVDDEGGERPRLVEGIVDKEATCGGGGAGEGRREKVWGG